MSTHNDVIAEDVVNPEDFTGPCGIANGLEKLGLSKYVELVAEPSLTISQKETNKDNIITQTTTVLEVSVLLYLVCLVAVVFSKHRWLYVLLTTLALLVVAVVVLLIGYYRYSSL